MADHANLKQALKDLNKSFGRNVVVSANEVPEIRQLPSGQPAFDMITTGGIMINQVNEFYGAFSSLKSWFAYNYLGIAQKYDWANNELNAFSGVKWKQSKSRQKTDGEFQEATFNEVDSLSLRRGYKPKNEPRYKYSVLIDVEGTYARPWGERLGIDNTGLLYFNPPTLENAVDVLTVMLSNPDVGLIVFDSMHAMGAAMELDNSMEDNQMAANSRFWNKASRKIIGALNSNTEHDTTLIVINGAGKKLGGYGDPEEIKNGEGMKWLKSISVRFNGLKSIEGKIDGVQMDIGRNVSIKNKKHKFGQPFLESEFYFSFVDDGVLQKGTTDVVSQLVELGNRFGLISRSGSIYQFDTLRVNGIEPFKLKLRENANNELTSLKTKVYEAITKMRV